MNEQKDPKEEFFESLGQLVFWGCVTGVILCMIWIADSLDLLEYLQ